MKGRFRPIYKEQSEKFTFLRVPSALFTDEKFRSLSNDAKLLYAFLLNRMDLSRDNAWFERDGRVFVIFPITEVAEKLRCGRDKAMKLLRELDTKHGIGLIERVGREAGRSDLIYVNDFSAYVEEVECGERPVGISDRSFGENGAEKCEKIEAGSGDEISPVGKVDPMVEKTDPVVENSDPRYIDLKNTDTGKNQSDPVYQSGNVDTVARSAMDGRRYGEDGEALLQTRRACERRIKEQISYDALIERDEYQYEKALIDGVVNILADTAAFARGTIRVNSMDLPYQHVRDKLLSIDQSSFEYAIGKLKSAGEERGVGSEKNYILTVLYNAPDTVDMHFSAMVNHDMRLASYQSLVEN